MAQRSLQMFSQPADVDRLAAGPDSLNFLGPTMTFIDPETVPERLLWLRADQGVFGGGAAHWDGRSQTQLRSTDTGLRTGYVDFGFACWVRINALPPVADLNRSNTHIAGKWAHTSNYRREWLLCLNSPTGADQFYFAARGSTTSGPRTTFPGGVEVGRWYFVVVWLDTVAQTLNMSVDGERLNPANYTGGLSGGTLPFTLGASDNLTESPSISMARATFFKEPMGGIGSRIDEIISSLYRDGAGADLGDLAPEQPPSWGMMAYWPLSEHRGVRRNAYRRNRNRDLDDPTGVGSAPGPFFEPPGHNVVVPRWVDQVEGQIFSGFSPVWKKDSARIVSNTRDDRFEHDSVLLSGRSTWTATVTAATRVDLGFGVYGESSGTEDEDSLELRVNHDGVPELAIKSAGGPEAVVRASDSLVGRRSATAISAEPIDSQYDDISRLKCCVHVGHGHPFAITEWLWIKGLGPSFDGLQLITHATEDEIHYITDNPASVPGMVGARRFAGGAPTTHPGPEQVLQETLDQRFTEVWSGSQWTVAGWVRKTSEEFDQLTEGSGIFAAKDCSDLRALGTRPEILHDGSGSPGSYELRLPGGPAAPFGAAPLETWVHLAAVRSGNLITLYYNGNLSGTLDVSSDPGLGSTFTGLSFGGNAELTAGLPCLLDNWGVWLGRSLSADEVGVLVNNDSGTSFEGLPGSLSTDLTAWYNFDEVSGTALDASGNSRHLTERGVVSSTEGIGGGIPYDSAVVDGLVVGTGCMQIASEFVTDAGRGMEYRRLVLTVRRDGPLISFFRNGEPIGSGTIDPAFLGPSSGSSRLLGASNRLGSPHGAIEHVHLVGHALEDADVLGLAARFSVRVNRTSGVGPLAVQFDATQLAGIDRMAAQDYQYLWRFLRSDTGELHDEFVSPVSGQSYARSTGFFVSQVFEHEGQYEAHLTVVTPRYDRQGQPQPQTCVFTGKVATITVNPWPDTTLTYYVSSTHPNRDDGGPGTSPETPLETVRQAIWRVTRPFTRILLHRGESFPILSRLDLSYQPGPLFIGAYGDSGEAKPLLVPSTQVEFKTGNSVVLTGMDDVRFSGIAIHDSGDMDSSSDTHAKMAFFSRGNNQLLLFHNLDVVETNQFFYNSTSDRSIAIDRCYLKPRGGYTIFSAGGFDFSMTRCAMEGFPAMHFLRLNRSQRSQVTHCYRDETDYPRGGGQSWVTVRHQSRYSVLTDSHGDLLHNSIQDHELFFMGLCWGMYERNRLRMQQTIGGSLITSRGNEMSVSNDRKGFEWRNVSQNIRGGTALEGRIYDNQFTDVVRIWRPDNETQLLVEEHNQLIDSPASLEAPEIETAEAVHGLAILAASGPGIGGPEGWSYRWMRRPVQSEALFEPLIGQKSAVIADAPPQPGTYEYRLDLVTASGIEAIGDHVATITISDDATGPGYQVTLPNPAHGRAGEPFGPFRVSLRGEIAADTLITILPISDGPGQFDPPQVVLSAEQPSAEFQFLPDPAPGGVGTWWLSTTNDAGLINPSPASFVVSEPLDGPDGPDKPGEPDGPPDGPPSPIQEPPGSRRNRFIMPPDVVAPAGDIVHRLSPHPSKMDRSQGAPSLPSEVSQPLSRPGPMVNPQQPPSNHPVRKERRWIPWLRKRRD